MTTDNIQHRTIGVLERPDGRVLFERRVSNKRLSTYWKLPGGKIGTDEGAREALIREMKEELGIHATQVRPWIARSFDYPHGPFAAEDFPHHRLGCRAKADGRTAAQLAGP